MAQNTSLGLFLFEKNFDSEIATKWAGDNWTYAVWSSLFYLVFVFSGTKYMQNKDPFNLRLPLAIWSSALAIFSALATFRIAPELYDTFTSKSFQYSVCNRDFVYEAPTSFWLFHFSNAKFVELGDTVFIVLRKQKLIFLHWYHHITVLIYTYYVYGLAIGPVRYFCGVNLFIHSIMYTYYALKALRFSVPKWINMVITLMQISQMVMGVIVTTAVIIYQNRGVECYMPTLVIVMTYLMYGSYFVLFADFFMKAYMSPKHRRSDDIKDSKKRL